ncbi:MAG: HEAT repeat protein [Planctomycetota bacterium]|jgi:HEAT repeat protein
MLRFPIGALAFLAITAQAQAQLDLPSKKGGKTETPANNSKKAERARNVASHLECMVCGERNFVARFDEAAKDSMQDAHCRVCQTTRTHRQKAGRLAAKGLDLPSGGRRGSGAQGQVMPQQAIAGDRAGGVDLALLQAARNVLDQVAFEKHLDSSVVKNAPDALLSLGQGGLAAVRVALASDHAPTMIVSLRTLLRAGLPQDADQVVLRLGTRMPTRAASAAVSELIMRDPVRATPELLCRLLAHPQSPVRSAAARALQDGKAAPTSEWLPYLQPALASRSGDSRMRAVDILAQIKGREAHVLLLEHLDDPRAKVVRRVVGILARTEDSQVEGELLNKAFGERWIVRSNACALLALIEREDRSLEPILHADHTTALLRGLVSSEPLVSGVCAAALAGLGFRDPGAETPSWLTREVPQRLVSITAGFRFFDDHEAIAPAALRRLRQITGQPFGANGPTWAEWWLANETNFKPSRAVLAATLEDAGRMAISWSDPARGLGFRLQGSRFTATAGGDTGLERFYLDEFQAKELFLRLEEEGVFGADCLPGPRGSQLGRSRSLVIDLGGTTKSFLYGGSSSDPWFERVATAVESLRGRNRWQRFPHPEKHGSQLALVQERGDWWAAHPDPGERGRAMAELVLDWMGATPLAQRDLGVLELERLYADSELSVARQADFSSLLVRVREETFFADRAVRLVGLALQAAKLGTGSAAASEISMDLGRELIAVLYEQYEVDAAAAIADVLERLGPPAVLKAVSDGRPLLRALAASLLSENPNLAETAALVSLLDDADPDVEIAAVQACGHGKVMAALDALMVRARVGEPVVRRAALEAIGMLGGDQAREVLLTTLTEPDGHFRVDAARGLARLGDPRVASVLVGLLREGRRSEIFAAARSGLLELGTGAFDNLYKAMRSEEPEVRREAALLLGRQMEPAAASFLVRVLAEDPTDRHVAAELAILSCVDYRSAAVPQELWWSWWDSVKHDEALPWFLAALEVRGLSAPQPIADHFGEELSRDAWLFLAEALRQEEPWLVERARREIEIRSQREVGDVPTGHEDREAWIGALVELLLAGAE